MIASTAPDTVSAARAAFRLATVAPERARALAAMALEAAEAAGDPEGTAVAEHALGLAAREANDLPAARAHLQRSIDAAVAAGLVGLAGEARTSLSLVLAYAGDTAEALRQADLAAAVLHGVEAARLLSQRALILQRLGRLDEALLGYRRALAAMRRRSDAEGEARLLTNRGVLHAYRGELGAAGADLRAAERRYVRLGMAPQAADVHHNLGFVAARRGDVPAALDWYDRAEQELRRLGGSRPVALLDRCETLLSVRLVAEARRVGAAAAEQLEASGMGADLAEARLLLAQAALLAGDLDEGRRLAALARVAFVHQRRHGWAALARYASLRGAWLAGDRSQRVLRAARDTARELAAAGWVGPAVDAHLIAGRIGLARAGHHGPDLGPAPGGGQEPAASRARRTAPAEAAEAEADLAAASRARRAGPADVRARGWHAEALLRRARDDRRGTDSALRAGMRVLARRQAVLGATELRVHAAAEATELGRLGLEVALESGRAERVLAWAERCRAGALMARPARPPADCEVAEDLAELRHLVSRVEEAGFAARDTGPLLRRQAALEASIRAKSWRAQGGREAGADRPPHVDQLRRGLDGAAMVELVESRGHLHAVVVARDRLRLRSLAPVADVDVEVNALRFALCRLARGRGSVASRAAAAGALAYAAARLDDLLLTPLRADVRDLALIVVPTGALHALPWGTLPSCRGRGVTVCPSAALWLRTTAAADGHTVTPEAAGPVEGGATVLVAGPGLAHACHEVTELSRAYPEALVLRPPRATTRRVALAIDGAGLAHVAAHGTFRADNPLFSSLRLADGPLTVYDLEGLRRAPRRLVLSACDAGLSAVRPGDELMGLSSALFGLGTRTLVASVAPVPDAVARPLMVELHRRLGAGHPPAPALAGAQEGWRDGEGEAQAASAFVCFGAG